MKKVFTTLAMALTLFFFAGQAMALSIGFDFDIGSSFYIEEGSSDLLGVNINLFNDSSDTVELSLYGGSFSSNGDYLWNQIGDIYQDYSLDPGETQSVLYREFGATVLDWTTFNYIPAEEGDRLNVTALSFNGTLDGTFGSWGISAIESGTNIFSVNIGTDVKPVPEPATILLFGAGIVGLAGFARRKGKN